ncbi:uncharacterized protein F4817DRAFT_321141 [Daldinia loculata]|uniref:uncharacterized protein n=1 Tax=Daldinia loculata TaxID=103429 RepID=UPI0020C47168|nr:uncharacterized protein F4817DRAFT_321141 [Daldinia loculata]KAI1642125.1 hypothetical protein F4817DRAFT_321141 [Daldinia loculata]
MSDEMIIAEWYDKVEKNSDKIIRESPIFKAMLDVDKAKFDGKFITFREMAYNMTPEYIQAQDHFLNNASVEINGRRAFFVLEPVPDSRFPAFEHVLRVANMTQKDSDKFLEETVASRIEQYRLASTSPPTNRPPAGTLGVDVKGYVQQAENTNTTPPEDSIHPKEFASLPHSIIMPGDRDIVRQIIECIDSRHCFKARLAISTIIRESFGSTNEMALPFSFFKHAINLATGTVAANGLREKVVELENVYRLEFEALRAYVGTLPLNRSGRYRHPNPLLGPVLKKWQDVFGDNPITDDQVDKLIQECHLTEDLCKVSNPGKRGTTSAGDHDISERPSKQRKTS